MKRAKTRILLVAPMPPPWGGIGKWTVLLSSWLATRSALDYRIINTSPWKREATDLQFGRRLLEGTIQGFVDALKTLFLIIFWRPSLIHLTTSGSLAGFRDVTVLTVARLSGVKSSYHIRIGRLPEITSHGSWEWRILKYAMQLSSKIILIDRASYLSLSCYFQESKLYLLPNAIDLSPHDVRMPADSNPGLKKVLFLGWILPAKGIDELITAWRQLAGADWELLLVGPYREPYKNEILKRVDNRCRIRFIGEVPNDQALGWIKAADILVLPTYTEGFPNVLLEAMAAEKPVIATPVGAIPEILDFDTNNPCGLKIPVRNSDALAQAIRTLMNSPGMRFELGHRARAKVESSYSAPEVFGRLLSIWADIACEANH
jgi:glycosyltransferase involved in cell wall biosynthesis